MRHKQISIALFAMLAFVFCVGVMTQVTFAQKSKRPNINSNRASQSEPEDFFDDQGILHSYTKSLSGRVVYTNVGHPIEAMKVELWTRNWKKKVTTAITDANGWFALPEVPEGKYYLKYYKKGYFGDKLVAIVTRRARHNLTLLTEAGF